REAFASLGLDACSRGVRTTRFCRRRPRRTSARSRARQRGQRPPQPAPTFVTFASAPLAGQDGGIEPVICGQNQIFFPIIIIAGAQRPRGAPQSLDAGLLRGACYRAGIRPTLWLAMTRGIHITLIGNVTRRPAPFGNSTSSMTRSEPR